MKVLIIEDEKELRKSVVNYLSQEGFYVKQQALSVRLFLKLTIITTTV